MEKNVVNLVYIKTADFVEGASIPTLALKDEEGNVRGYLHPFRGYRFQVSGSAEGNGDYGSSEVVGLANIVTGRYTGRDTAANPSLSVWASNSGDIVCSIFEAFAWNALFEFTGRGVSLSEENDIPAIDYVCHSFELREKVHELAKRTIGWINSLL